MLTRIRNVLAEQGLVGFVMGRLARAVERATRGRVRIVWYVLVAQPVKSDWRIPSRLGSSISVRSAIAGDALLAQAPRPPAVIAGRFEQGATCIVAARGDELLGYLWLCPDRYVEDEVRCTFVLPDAASRWWDFDVWVRPAQRSGVVFARLWQEAHARMHALGVQWTCSRIARLNPGSLAAHRRLGAVVVGQAIFVRGARRQLMTALPPRLHYSGDPREVPEIRVARPRHSSDGAAPPP